MVAEAATAAPAAASSKQQPATGSQPANQQAAVSQQTSQSASQPASQPVAADSNQPPHSSWPANQAGRQSEIQSDSLFGSLILVFCYDSAIWVAVSIAFCDVSAIWVAVSARFCVALFQQSVKKPIGQSGKECNCVTEVNCSSEGLRSPIGWD